MVFRKVIIGFFLISGILAAQDTITGTYSYTYGDSESLVDARQSCKDLALREAIESYYIFVESSTEVDNFQIKEDIIKSISAGYLKDIKVVDQNEEGRTITMTVEATVSADEIKKVVEEIATAGRETSTESETEISTDTLRVRESDSEKYPFLRALASFEKRLSNVEEASRHHRFDDALSQIQNLESKIEPYQPKRERSFQYILYQTVFSYTQLIGDLVQIEKLESQGKKVRVRYRLSQAKKIKVELNNYLKQFEKLQDILDWKKVIRRRWVSRCRSAIDKLNKKAATYSRR